MVLQQATQAGATAGKVGLNLLMTPHGLMLAGIILLALAWTVIFMGIAGTLCCIFAPHWIATAGLVIMAMGVMFTNIVPQPIKTILVVILLALATLVFMQPDWVGLAVV